MQNPSGGGYILNFFADTVEDIRQAPTNTPYITRNGTNYGIPLDTSVITVVEDGVKVNYILRDGKYVAANKDVELNIAYGEICPVDTNKLWIKTDKPEVLNLAKNTKGDFVKYSDDNDIELPFDHYAYLMSGTVCNEHLYIFGGSEDVGLDEIMDYDIINNTISVLPTTLPTPLFGIACATVGDKIYLFGGASDVPNGIERPTGTVDMIQEFDTTARTIKTLGSTLESKATYITAVAVENNIYLFGGLGESDDSNKYFNTIQKFDTTTKTITTLPITLSNPATFVITGAVDKKIYLLSGWTDNELLLNTIQIFDTTTESIITLPQTTIGIQSNCYGVIGTKIIIATGNGGSTGDMTSEIFCFDTLTLETNKVGDYKDLESCMGGAAYKNILYGFGGYQISGNTLAKFIFTFPLDSGDIFVQETLNKNIFDLMSMPTKIEIGVQNVYKGNSSNEAEFVDSYLYDGKNWVDVNTGEKFVNKQ